MPDDFGQEYQKHRDLMRRHEERREVDWERVPKDRRRSDSRFEYMDLPGRNAGIALEVPGLGFIVIRARENPDDPKGKLDYLTLDAITCSEARHS